MVQSYLLGILGEALCLWRNVLCYCYVQQCASAFNFGPMPIGCVMCSSEATLCCWRCQMLAWALMFCSMRNAADHSVSLYWFIQASIYFHKTRQNCQRPVPELLPIAGVIALLSTSEHSKQRQALDCKGTLRRTARPQKRLKSTGPRVLRHLL